MKSGGITISQIAQQAGVSKTTVSRYLNGKYEYMSGETRDKIASIIELTGYRPNSVARSLKSQKSMLIGLVVADIESPFSSAAIKSIGDVMNRAGYNVVIANSDNSYEKECDAITSLIHQQTDGLIINTASYDNPFIKKLAESKTPIVLLDRQINSLKLDCVSIENTDSINRAIQHLKSSGYGRIALFTESYDTVSPRMERRSAFLTCGGDDVYTVDTSNSQSIENAVCKLMTLSRNDSAPPAIIASNGVTTVSCVKAIRDLNLKMPYDLGLCGYDDWGKLTEMRFADFIDVGITTFAADVSKVGEKAAEMLLERMNTSDKTYDSAKTVLIPTTLIKRKSTDLKIQTER